MNPDEQQTPTLKRIRFLLLLFIVGLVFSGATAIPLVTEIKNLPPILSWLGIDEPSGAYVWIEKIKQALVEMNARYPFMAYGTDWLAFAHFVIAIAFIGPWRDPARNVWVIDFGMIACLLVVPFAFIMGEVRGIPIGWRLIDCSFGVLGIIPLWICRREIEKLKPKA